MRRMIRKVIIKNFKSIHEQAFEFSSFDLLVGRNNTGKSTVLQALAIWQYCIDEFLRAKRKGKGRGIGVVLPNFTALPVPEFNLLWRERTDRRYSEKKGVKSKTPQYILIEIGVHWEKEGNKCDYNVHLRYQSSQNIYAIPASGWSKFDALNEKELFPRIAFVPPFSGLEPEEERKDDGPLRKTVGKAQPGGVLRNLLLRACQNHPADWRELSEKVKEWFSVDLLPPAYEEGRSTTITCEYKDKNKKYDIISGGSGFHQTLTLLAFFYGYHPDVILLDEPDAHLHVNLQSEILRFFKGQSLERGIQFLIATHAEALMEEVEVSNILSLLPPKPRRIPDTQSVMDAMSKITNQEATRILETKAVLYLEGTDDERILGMWEQVLGRGGLKKLLVHYMRGGSKQAMLAYAGTHFRALREIEPSAKQMILLDRDDTSLADESNPVLCEWKRRNIENYLLVKPAWQRALLTDGGQKEIDLFSPYGQSSMIDDFFKKQGLLLPETQDWKTLSANVFEVVDGKKILFESPESLFHLLRKEGHALQKGAIAGMMLPEEIHEDVETFFNKLAEIVTPI